MCIPPYELAVDHGMGGCGVDVGVYHSDMNCGQVAWTSTCITLYELVEVAWTSMCITRYELAVYLCIGQMGGSDVGVNVDNSVRARGEARRVLCTA